MDGKPHQGLRMMRGVYINLDRAHERRAAMERTIADARPPYAIERFAAIDGALRPDVPAALTPGEHGVWLSHTEVLERSLARDEHLHVMEDDVALSKAVALLPDLIGLVEGNTGGDWDLLYLDATLVEIEDMCRMFEWTRSSKKDGNVNVCSLPADFTVYGAHSYVVNRARRGKLLDFLRRNAGSGKPFDDVLAAGVRKQRLRAFVTAPFITSASELSPRSQVTRSGDEKFAAWWVFRRLCFADTDEAVVAQLGPMIDELTKRCSGSELLLGRLLAYRLARWPSTRFPPDAPVE
jgi:GR25 family glycosyltransferase involved in LPS biosynthesis